MNPKAPPKNTQKQKTPQQTRQELIKQITKNRQAQLKLNKKISQIKQKHQKIMESTGRNEKRLLRHQAKIEEMNKHKDNPEIFLAMSGLMNEYVQQYILSHNYVLNVNPNDMNPDNMSYQQLIELGEQIGKVSKGLTKEQIEALVHRKNKNTELQCPICCHEIELNEIVIQLKCKHTFHEDCILMWLKDENTCPMCKDYLAEEGSKSQKLLG